MREKGLSHYGNFPGTHNSTSTLIDNRLFTDHTPKISRLDDALPISSYEYLPAGQSITRSLGGFMTARPPNPRKNKNFAWVLCATLVLIAGFVLALTHGKTATATPAASPVAAQQRALAAYGNLPLAFEPNQGQTDPQVKYMARGNGYTLFLTNQEAVLSLLAPSKSDAKISKYSSKSERFALRMKMVGANPRAEIAAEQSLPGKSNYYIGNDPSKWQAGVPEFARVSYRNIYPGIDLAFHGAQKQTEFDFLVSSGADPRRISLAFDGAQSIHLDEGALVLATSIGDVRMHPPVAYQEKNGSRQPVAASFILAANDVRIGLGNYDHSRQLIIDPSLSYSTYFGGGGEDQASSLVIDGSGNAYITGEAGDNTFPHTSGTFAGGLHDASLFELNSSGARQFSVIFGGSGDDSGNAIAIDGSGNVYVAGGTGSSNFPHTTGVFQTSIGSGASLNAFVAKFTSGGSMTYSTYLGGGDADFAAGIAIDGSGNAYVTGQATSTNFPTTVSAYQSSLVGSSAAFVTELNPTATAPLVYSTYLGGSGVDNGVALALDSSDKIYVTGDTIPGTGAAFPITGGVVQGTSGGGTDAFVAEIDPTKSLGASLIYSTFLGGSANEQAYGIAVDTSGSAYVTGSTMSSNFPTANAYQSSLKGSQDAFLTKLNVGATTRTFSSFLGGSGTDVGLAIVLDTAKAGSSIYVTGQTASSDFPTMSPTQPTFAGGDDAFVTSFSSSGSNLALSFSTYLGGSGQEDVTSTGLSGGIAVDGSGNIYVAGDTASSDFPVTAGAFQSTYGGGAADAFVVKISPSGAAAGFSVATTPTSMTVTHGQSAGPFTSTVTPSNGFSGTVTLTCTGLPSGAGCGFSPSTVSTSGTSTLTITTTARSASLNDSSRRGFYFAFLVVPGLALVGIGFVPGKSNKQKLLGFVLCCMLFSGLAFMAACGGSSSGGGGGGGGTPPGTYSVIVGGSSGSVTASGTTTISLTVQ